MGWKQGVWLVRCLDYDYDNLCQGQDFGFCMASIHLIIGVLGLSEWNLIVAGVFSMMTKRADGFFV